MGRRACWTPSATAPGGSTVTGTYSGDTNFQGSTGTASIIVNAATTTTTVTAQTPNPSTLGQAVMFTATVMDTSSGVAAVASGTVNFFDGGTTLIGSAPLNGSGNATFTTALLSSTSPHSITVAFIGNADFSASVTSSPVSQVVGPRASTTAVSVSPGTVPVGAPSTVMVTVTDTLPTGSTGTPGAFALTSKILNVGRTGHAAALLPNGTVLIAGGEDASSNVLNSAEIYDPVARTFTSLTGAGQSLTTPRVNATATLLNNGTVLIAGGSSDGTANGALTNAEIYDPVAGTFTLLGNNLTTPRTNATATLFYNGTAWAVLIAGGQNSTGPLNTTETYDPTHQTFTVSSGLLSVARYGHTATLLASGKILMAGGAGLSSAELYDPIAGSSTPTGSMTTDRTIHAAALLPDGNVLIAGGKSSGSAVNSTELYNTAAGTFASTGNMQTARSGLTATTLDGAQVLVVGGSNSTYPALASAELYAPSFDPLGTVSVTSSDGTDGITGLPCTLALSGSGTTTCTGAVTDTPIEVGTNPHVITGTYQPAPDYVHTNSSNAASLIVNKATPVFSNLTASQSITYGQNSVTLTGTLSANCGTGCSTVYPPSGETVSVTVGSASGSGTISGTSGAFSVTVTGTGALGVSGPPYPIQYSYAGDSNFNTASDASTSLTVQKATPMFSNLTASQVITYGTPSISLAGTISAPCGTGCMVYPPTMEMVSITINGVTVTPAIGSNGYFSATFNTSTIPVSMTAYTITYSYGGDSNFNSATNTSTTLTVNKATPVFSALTASQTITYGTPSINLAGIISAPCGMGCIVYPPTTETVSITINGVTATPAIGSNGSFSATFATSTIPASATAYTITYSYNTNYADTNFKHATDASTTLTVTTRPITATLTAANKTYDATNTEPTNAMSCMLNGVLPADSSYVSCTASNGTFNTSQVATANLVTATVTISGTAAGNYTLGVAGTTVSSTSATATAHITPAAASVTPNPATKIYGAADPVFTGTLTGFLPADVVMATYARTAGQTVAGSPYTTSATLSPASALSNYNITYNTASFTITPAALTITASSGSMIYGGPVPPITPSYATFVNGDTYASLTTQPSCGTLAISSSPVGMYASTCSGASDSNYTIMYSPGIVTVIQASTSTTIMSSLNPSNWQNVVTLTATVTPQYPGTMPTGSVSFYNVAYGTACSMVGTITALDTDPLSSTSPYTASTSTPNLPVGTDTILACYNGDTNFSATSTGNGTTTTLSQVVIAAPIVTLSPASLSFGGQAGGTTSSAQTVTVCNGPSGASGFSLLQRASLDGSATD